MGQGEQDLHGQPGGSGRVAGVEPGQLSVVQPVRQRAQCLVRLATWVSSRYSRCSTADPALSSARGGAQVGDPSDWAAGRGQRVVGDGVGGVRVGGERLRLGGGLDPDARRRHPAWLPEM